MLQIYICDDEPSVLKYLSGFISRIAQKNNLEICLSCYDDERRLIFDLEDHINGADIIYLDVLMNSCNGIEAGKKIRALGCEAQLLYLTNSKHHAIASFDTSPLHYICLLYTSQMISLRKAALASQPPAVLPKAYPQRGRPPRCRSPPAP